METTETSTTAMTYGTVDMQGDGGQSEGPTELLPAVYHSALQDRLLYGAAVVANLLPAICVLGFVGNTFSFLVVVRRQNRQLSACVYMMALAVSDNLSLGFIGHYWVRTSGYFGLLASWECTYIAFGGLTCVTFGVLMVLCMTTERFLAIRFPLKAKSLCTVRRARLTICILAVISCVYHIPFLFISRTAFNGKFEECYPYGVPGPFTTVYSFLNIALNSVVPFTILLVFNGFIIATVQGRKKHFESQGTSSSGASPSSGKSDGRARERQLTTMLLTVSFALLILTLPQYANYVYNGSFKLRITPNPLRYYGTYALIDVIANRCFYTNNAINFLLYCMTGSKFRQDLWKTFHCLKKDKSPASWGNAMPCEISTTVTDQTTTSS